MTIKKLAVIGFVLGALSCTFAFADVPIIMNPQQAPVENIIQMEEVWRIGSDMDEDYILGIIRMVISDEDGNFYLLDTQQREVFKFSPEGEYLKSVSRKGEGPGEIERCYFFGFWDKNTIACFNNFPQKFVRFNLEGIPVETLTMAIIRPMSGSGSVGVLSDLIQTHGEDSIIVKIAATMFGSTETTCADSEPSN